LNLESQSIRAFCGSDGDAGDAGTDEPCAGNGSSGVGVAVAMVAGGDTLEHVHFSRLGRERAAVVVTSSGLVRDRMLTMQVDLTARELEAAGELSE